MESMASCTLRIQTDTSDPFRQGWKKPGLKKKNQPSVFFGFFVFFVVFFGSLPQKSVLGVFSVSRILLGSSRL
jgi:hypothetical protein